MVAAMICKSQQLDRGAALMPIVLVATPFYSASRDFVPNDHGGLPAEITVDCISQINTSKPHCLLSKGLEDVRQSLVMIEFK
jgi:hypothetical protein